MSKTEIQIVPIVPTPEMLMAGRKEALWVSGDVAEVWRVMLIAAKNAADAQDVLNVGAGWTVHHPKYGKWFISRAAVIADWKHYRAQAYTCEPAREPTDEEVETWWREQTTWTDIAANGKQLERPDMAAHEAAWLRKMARDPDVAS